MKNLLQIMMSLLRISLIAVPCYLFFKYGAEHKEIQADIWGATVLIMRWISIAKENNK